MSSVQLSIKSSAFVVKSGAARVANDQWACDKLGALLLLIAQVYMENRKCNKIYFAESRIPKGKRHQYPSSTNTCEAITRKGDEPKWRKSVTIARLGVQCSQSTGCSTPATVASIRERER